MARFWTILAVLLTLAACQETELASTPPDAATAAACRVTYVVDGDTLHLDCGAGRRKVRLLGYDTPEIYHPHCAAEAEAGRQATDVLARLVASGPITALSVQGQDRYGRDLATLSIAGQDVAAQMLASGLAAPYTGHNHPDWCS